MTWFQRFWRHNIRCRSTSCTLDWLHERNGGGRQCEWCEHSMPEPLKTVGMTHPDAGD